MTNPSTPRPKRTQSRIKYVGGWSAAATAVILFAATIWMARYRWIGYWGNETWSVAAELRTGQLVLIIQQPGEPGSTSVVIPERERFKAWEWIYDQTTAGKTPKKGTVAVATLWPIASVAGITGLLLLRAVRRGFNQATGQCAGCGYSRSGLATSAVCPECGATQR